MTALGWAVLILGCTGGDPTATDPRKVFADGFVSALDGVEIEAEGGTIIGGYDAWLVLRPSGAPIPRYQDRFGPIPCDEPAAYFARLPAGVRLVRGGGALDCRACGDSRLSVPNGRWLIEDHRDGRVYFRVWKGRAL